MRVCVCVYIGIYINTTITDIVVIINSHIISNSILSGDLLGNLHLYTLISVLYLINNINIMCEYICIVYLVTVIVICYEVFFRILVIFLSQVVTNLRTIRIVVIT